MPLVTEYRLAELVHLPVQLPSTQLPVGAWLAVASVRVVDGQQLRFRFLQLSLLELETSDSADECGVTSSHLMNEAFPAGGLAAVLLIKDWVPSLEPWGQTVLDLVTVPVDLTMASKLVPPVTVVRGTDTVLTLSEPGVYSWVVLNNSTNRVGHVSVDGSAILDLAPLA